MKLHQLKQEREHLLEIACDLIFLMVTCKYNELNKHREEELARIKKRIVKLEKELKNVVDRGN